MRRPFGSTLCSGRPLGSSFILTALVLPMRKVTSILNEPRRLRCLLFVFAVCFVAPPAIVSAQEDESLAVTAGEAVEEKALEDEGLEDEDIGLLELEIPVVVTAARREQKITTMPYAVSVITAEDIRRSGARSIPDALRLVPGVDVADLSFGNAAVSPRGLHGLMGYQLPVLVDGRQIFDSIFGGCLWGSWPFQLEDIERIEVIRGSTGVTWGGNAINGVVNIVTKDPADQAGLTFTAGGGSRGTHKEHVGYALRDGRLRLRVSGEYEASDGFRKGGSILRNLEDDYKAGRMGLHAIYEAGPDDTLTISAGSGLMDGGYPPMPLAVFDRRRNSGSQASFLLGRWSHQIADDSSFEWTAYVNDFHMSAGVSSIEYRYQQLALQFRHTFRPADTHSLVWGFDSRTDLFDATNADPFFLSKPFASSAIIGLYLEDEWRFAPNWALNLGGRIDYEFYGGFQPSARAALVYKMADDSLIYGGVSRAFQMDPVAERFVHTPLLNGLAWVKGDRDVDAETLIAYEMGYRTRLFNRLETNVNVFWNEYRDLATISPTLGPPGLICYRLGNRASASMYGIEFDAKYEATSKLTLLGNYTFQRLNWRSARPFHEMDLISPPKHKFMLGGRYSATDDLHLSSHLYYVDAVKAPNPGFPLVPRRVDPYFRLDLRAEYEFLDDRASLAIGVRNLLDGHHYEGGTMFLNDSQVPRMIFAEFRITLK